MSWNSGPFNDIPWNAGDAAPPDPGITGEGTLIAIEQRVYTPEFRGGFAWNMQAWNTIPWNGSRAPEALIGEGTIIAIEQTVVEPAEGTLIAIEQIVGIVGEGTLISIEQTVELQLTGEGTLIAIEQQVATYGEGTLIRIEQRVKNVAETIPSQLDRFGWEVYLNVGGAGVPCQTGTINIQRNEGGASLMDITFMPGVGSGLQDAESFAGKPVTLDIETADGVFRAFTGMVDIPEIDVILKSITLRCTDNRTELINSQMGLVVNTIGYYSGIIFGTSEDTYENLTHRLTTVPLTVDFDPYGNFHITSIFAKATPDFSLTGNEPNGVRYRDPTVEFTSRARITNRVDISFAYRRPRLWHIQRSWSWTWGAGICDMLQRGYTLAPRTMIQRAVEGTGWPLRTPIAFTPIWPGGWYCGGIAWSTVQLRGVATNVLDSSGKQVYDIVWEEDPDTHFQVQKQVPRTEARITGGTDIALLMTLGASWTGTKRWVQTIVENFSLTVQAPQSIAQYDVIKSDSSYSGEDPTSTTFWESDYKIYDNRFNQVNPTYFIDPAANRGEINFAMVTALAIAKTTILRSHRDTRVSFYRALWPQLDLKHTVQINATMANGGALNAKGKVYTIEHYMNITTGEAYTKVVLALSRSRGSATDSGFAIPAINFSGDSLPNSSPIVLGNHWGQDPEGPGAESWSGYVGNKIRTDGVFGRTNYTEQFIVDVPPIDAPYRDERNVSIGANYNVAIPNDLLEVYF